MFAVGTVPALQFLRFKVVSYDERPAMISHHRVSITGHPVRAVKSDCERSYNRLESALRARRRTGIFSAAAPEVIHNL